MSEVMIEARNLSKRYGDVRAVDHVEFSVRKGEVVGFLGPNGAGKTTTMKILTCFIAPTEGTAIVNGHDIFEESLAVRQSIGYLPEHTPLYPEMMVYDYLQFVAQLRGLREDEAKHIKRVVEQTGLGDVLGKEIRTLSRGYRQRVGLAQALIHEPPILILDEPLSGLDPNQASEIRDLITAIGKERTVILSTHNLAEVQVTCQRVLIIARGKIVADDSTQQLRERAGRTRHIVSVLPQSTMDVSGKALETFSRLEHAKSVRNISRKEGEVRFEIEPAGSHDLGAELFRAAVGANLVLTELSREGEDLEAIFRELTLAQQGSETSSGREQAA